jgi:hypothetical protein
LLFSRPSLDAYLADLLFAHRRWQDDIETEAEKDGAAPRTAETADFST